MYSLPFPADNVIGVFHIDVEKERAKYELKKKKNRVWARKSNQQISELIDTLKSRIPHKPSGPINKHKTLRLAQGYIQHLANILQNPPGAVHIADFSKIAERIVRETEEEAHMNDVIQIQQPQQTELAHCPTTPTNINYSSVHSHNYSTTPVSNLPYPNVSPSYPCTPYSMPPDPSTSSVFFSPPSPCFPQSLPNHYSTPVASQQFLSSPESGYVPSPPSFDNFSNTSFHSPLVHNSYSTQPCQYTSSPSINNYPNYPPCNYYQSSNNDQYVHH